ncbi:SH3 domain-containing protein, partial [Streptomyces sp. UNOC14_S4]|uniref:SH3 domain-containing protein n=1 Tax=Streptomyces sp. UNOC14_S4 TaxID=2872340 RepID=UPI001E5B9280
MSLFGRQAGSLAARRGTVTLGVMVALCAPAGGASAGGALSAVARGRYEGIPGQVISKVGQNVRKEPTTASPVVRRYGPGARVRIDCRTDGEYIDGDKYWYRLADGGWMSARYVRAFGTVPLCRSGGHDHGHEHGHEHGHGSPAGPKGSKGPKGD